MQVRSGLGAIGCMALASCAAGGLERASELGGAGANFSTRLTGGYAAAQEVYTRGDLLDCVNFYMAQPDFRFQPDQENPPDCDRARREGQLQSGVAAGEAALFTDRIVFAEQLTSAYAEFQAFAADEDSAPNLGPALSAAAVSAERVQQALTSDETWSRMQNRWTPQRRAELRAAAGLIGQAIDGLSQRNRLNSARDASRALRGMLEILDASYEVEAAVIDSVREIDYARRGLALEILREGELIDEDALGERAQAALEEAGIPVIGYTGSGPWATPQSRALIDYVTQRQTQDSLERARMANSTVRAGLRALIEAHRDFETREQVSIERVDVITEQMDTFIAEE